MDYVKRLKEGRKVAVDEIVGDIETLTQEEAAFILEEARSYGPVLIYYYKGKLDSNPDFWLPGGDRITLRELINREQYYVGMYGYKWLEDYVPYIKVFRYIEELI